MTEEQSKKKQQRARSWCFTLNNWTPEEYAKLRELGLAGTAKYLVLGREIGESGTPHIQGFISLKDPKTLAAMKTLLSPRVHLEKMRGTFAEAANYCKKDGLCEEFGSLPTGDSDGRRKAMKQSNEERWALAKAGKFEELPPENLAKYRQIYYENRSVEERTELDNIWLFGISGSGKSRYVRDTYPGAYTKPMNKWWDLYQDEDVVCIEDVDPSHGEWLGYFLKIWADHYPFRGEVKGGTILIRPRTLLVTSQYPLEACFKDPETVAALLRRFTCRRIGPEPEQYAPCFVPVCKINK